VERALNFKIQGLAGLFIVDTQHHNSGLFSVQEKLRVKSNLKKRFVNKTAP